MRKILVLGVGPGSPRYLSPVVMEQARRCDVLVGGRRNLVLFDLPGQEKVEISGELAPLFALIREQCARRVVGVLVSGDPGLYSILPCLEREFGRENLAVYPGISAVQYLFARLGLPWHDALVLSLHGRKMDDLVETVRANRKVALFTHTGATPAAVCALLLQAGVREKKIFLGEDLSYPTEHITEGRPEDFTGCRASDLNVMVIVDA